MDSGATTDPFPHRHLLGIEGLSRREIIYLLDRADGYANQPRGAAPLAVLRGRR